MLWLLQLAAHINPIGPSFAPHFVAQADAWLHGRWNVAMAPGTVDTADVRGKVYILYPPFPAILLLPFVAIFGRATSDTLFTAVLASGNLALLYLLFEQARANGWTRHTRQENLFLSILLAFGSINLWLSLGGSMWFTAQVVGMTLSLGALLLAFRRHYGWSAVLIGCALLTRATLVLGAPLLLWLAWDDLGRHSTMGTFVRSLLARRPDWTALPWRRLLSVATPISTAAVLWLVRNALVFGSPLESGYGIVLRQQYPDAKYGVFSLRYIPANIIANFFNFPRITYVGPHDLHPTIDLLNQGIGVSVFVTTPLFLLLFWRNRAFNPLRAALWSTLGLMVLAILPFHEAGWFQFGARYLFDGYPYAFLLLMLNEMPIARGQGKGRRVDWRILALGLLGICINIMGAIEVWTGHMYRL
jgi:hypothetical protein